MQFLLKLYERIFGKVNKAILPSTEKEQIKEMLDGMLKQVDAGTAKIDDQISELNEISRMIDKAEERAKSEAMEKLSMPPEEFNEMINKLPDDDPLPFGKSGEAEEFIKSLDDDSLPFGKSGEAEEFIKSLDEVDPVTGRPKGVQERMDDVPDKLLPPTSLNSMLEKLASKTGLTPEQVKKALVDNLNEGYAPNDPKRMRLDENERLEAFLQVKMKFGDEDELLEDIIEGFYRPTLDAFKEAGEEVSDIKSLKEPKSNIEAVMDDDLKAAKQQKKDLERAEELMADIENFGKSFDEIMQMVQDEKVIPFIKYKPNPKPKKKATGGRVQLKDGGGPKITRRSVLQMMGAGIGSLMMPRGAKKVADAMAPTIKKIVPAPGMPDWFPLLAQQIKTKGKKVREPDYADFTSGGDTTVRYELKDKNLAGDKIFLEEDMQTGTVSIFGRGDDYQQVSMDYFPGSRSVDKSGRIRETEPDFEMMEFAKGEIQDIENFGGIDEMRGDLGSWIKLSGIDKTAKKQLEEVKKLFKEETKDPNVDVDEFAKGGGVGSLFKRKA